LTAPLRAAFWWHLQISSGLPIHAIGVGEQIDDLQPFDPQEFADALLGLDPQ